MTSWSRSALGGAVRAAAIAACIALSAGLVRLLPWLLDPGVTWRVAMPFARSLTVVALEAALAVGWPVGWGLAAQALVERGEGRVLALLGQRPLATASRLLLQGGVLAVVLAALSFASARKSTEPGRVVSELLAHGRAACTEVDAPRTYAVPFFGATWLCGGAGVVPRLVGQGPGRLAPLAFSARDARASGDLGSIELDDAHVTLASPPATLHVDSLHIRGAAPWGHAATVPPVARALTLGSSVAMSGFATVLLVLTILATRQSRLIALLVGASGPIAALALLRAAERFVPANPASLVGVPVLALVAPLATAWMGARLPGLWHAASKYGV